LGLELNEGDLRIDFIHAPSVAQPLAPSGQVHRGSRASSRKWAPSMPTDMHPRERKKALNVVDHGFHGFHG
jgi:hypothetical protein